MFELDNCISFATNRAAKKMAEAFNDRLMALGVSRVKWIALYYLSMHPGISQRELAIYMHIKSSTVARLVDRMEKEGLIDRIKDKADRRVSVLKLTDAGAELMDKLLPEGRIFSELVTQGISSHEMEVYYGVLDKLVSNIGYGK